MMSALLAFLGLEIPDRTAEEIGLAVAMVLVVVGSVLHWKLPRQRMSFEERVKDNEMTEEQAARWIKIYSICAPLVTFAGLGVLIAVLIDALE